MKLINSKQHEKYLPLGTVVLIQNNIKAIMIMGYLIKDENGNMYDYAGVYYPEGYAKKEFLLKFNHEQIVGILNIGLVFDKQKEYNDFLNGKIEEYKF